MMRRSMALIHHINLSTKVDYMKMKAVNDLIFHYNIIIGCVVKKKALPRNIPHVVLDNEVTI